MNKFLLALFAAVAMTGGLVAQDAEAARLGGGRSFGMNRSVTPAKPAAAPAPAPTAPTASQNLAGKPAAAPTAPAPQPSGMSRWLGPIAGLAAGIGLAALLSHFGLGEGMANVLMILLLVMAAVFVFRLLFRKKAQPAPMQYAGAGAPMRFEPVTPEVSAGGTAAAAATAAAASVPAGFDSEGFLRQAKLNFIRLQAANDKGDLDDLKQFTTPEIFAEIKMQLEERGRAKQETDVAQLNAELLEVVTEGDRHIASVHFHGQIREEANGAAQPFAEVWHLAKPVDGSRGWLVAGIQQLQ